MVRTNDLLLLNNFSYLSIGQDKSVVKQNVLDNVCVQLDVQKTLLHKANQSRDSLVSLYTSPERKMETDSRQETWKSTIQLGLGCSILRSEATRALRVKLYFVCLNGSFPAAYLLVQNFLTVCNSITTAVWTHKCMYIYKHATGYALARQVCGYVHNQGNSSIYQSQLLSNQDTHPALGDSGSRFPLPRGGLNHHLTSI